MAGALTAPVVVELAAPPGAGKSTVFDELRRQEPAVVPSPVLSRGPHAARLGAQLVAAATRVGPRALRGPDWSRDLLVMTAYLNALPPVLERWHGPEDAVVVFDQGPLFTLTRPGLLVERLRDWREATLDLWVRRLDFVVWLDAADAVLAERIEARAKTHRIKGADPVRTADWLAADRSRFGDVLQRCERTPDGAAVLRFDTGAQPAAAVAAEILAAVRAR